jgi:IS5 family transposase
MMRAGTIVDATLIAAPPSIKKGQETRSGNAPVEEGQRLAFRHESTYGSRPASGLVHTVVGTAGNVANVTQAHGLLHGDEVAVVGDAGYQGVENSLITSTRQ